MTALQVFVGSALALSFDLVSRGMHGLDFGFFGPGLRLRPAGSGLRFS